jgi:hypothetical protein
VISLAAAKTKKKKVVKQPKNNEKLVGGITGKGWVKGNQVILMEDLNQDLP